MYHQNIGLISRIFLVVALLVIFQEFFCLNFFPFLIYIFYVVLVNVAWIQVTGKGNAVVTAIFKTSQGFKPAGLVIAQAGCWSMLKGGLSVDFAGGPVELYFQVMHLCVFIRNDHNNF